MLIFGGIALLVLLAGCAAAGWLYQRSGERRDAEMCPPPGRLVDVDGVRLHVDVRGEGPVVVVFEAGIAASCLNWRRVQTEVAKFATTVSYDRAGYGWSELSTQPRRADLILEEARALLAATGLRGPYVYVGHSFGGLVGRLYAERYREELAGLVLVDPVPVCEWLPLGDRQRRRLAAGTAFSRWGALLARFGVVRFALSRLERGETGTAKRMAKLTAGPAAKVTERIAAEVGKMPREVWPAIRAHWSRPKPFLSMASHLAELPASMSRVRGSSLGDLPVVVLSGEHLEEEAAAEHAAVAASSTRGRQQTVKGTAHWVHLDAPEVVVAAIREVMEPAVRAA